MNDFKFRLIFSGAASLLAAVIWFVLATLILGEVWEPREIWLSTFMIFCFVFAAAAGG